MSHPLVIANWKMNIPSGGISGWIQSEMVSNNDEEILITNLPTLSLWELPLQFLT